MKNNNNLKISNPKLAKQWHPSKNANLLPDNIDVISCEKVWWICDRGHEIDFLFFS